MAAVKKAEEKAKEAAEEVKNDFSPEAVEPTVEEGEEDKAEEVVEEEELRSPDAIVKKYMLWSMAAGMAPAFVDSVAVSAIQLKLLHALANRYGVKFSQNSGKSVIASLVGGLGSGAVSRSSAGSMLKLIPIIGPIVGSVAMPVISGASTYAIGKVFVRHFDSGGTFLDFDPAKAKKPFEKLFQEGKSVASKVDKAMDKAVDKLPGSKVKSEEPKKEEPKAEEATA